MYRAVRGQGHAELPATINIQVIYVVNFIHGNVAEVQPVQKPN